MVNGAAKKQLREIKSIQEKIGARQALKLELKQLERLIARLGQFSEECEECQTFLSEIAIHTERLKKSKGTLEKPDLQEFKRISRKIASHLRRKHKLVSRGHYSGIGISIGMLLAIPVAFFTRNTLAGFFVGVCAGTLIGTKLDSNANKKGLVI